MSSQTFFALAIVAGAGFLSLVSCVLAAPPPSAPYNPFPPSFYGFNPGYYGPYYPGQYQYGKLQPGVYAPGYASPTFTGSGTSGGVPEPYSSRLYGSSATFAATASASMPPISSSGYRVHGLRASAFRGPAPEQTTVLARVHVPTPDAELWVEGWQTASRGSWRPFRSPPLIPGKRYVYEIRAQWFENGRQVNQTRKIPVRAGQEIVVDFTRPQPEEAQSVLRAGARSSR